jgi:hypothetical protein
LTKRGLSWPVGGERIVVSYRRILVTVGVRRQRFELAI